MHDRNKWQMTATPAGPYSAAGRSKNPEGPSRNPRPLEGVPLFRPNLGEDRQSTPGPTSSDVPTQ